MPAHEIPNPHGTTSGRPYVPLQSMDFQMKLNGKLETIRLCRYQAGMVMIEFKGRGVNVSGEWGFQNLKAKFDHESAKPAANPKSH